MQRIKVYSIEEVEAIVKDSVINSSCEKGTKKDGGTVELDGYEVYRRSLRYKTFIEKGYKCVCCGRVGSYYALEKSKGSNAMRAHFNLYSDDDVLMTKDHIFPKSKGGRDCIENMQTMCSICNCSKGNYVPEDYVPDEVQLAKKYPDNREYFWCGDCRFATLKKAAIWAIGGKTSQQKVAMAKGRIRKSVREGEPYHGSVWRYGKEIEVHA